MPSCLIIALSSPVFGTSSVTGAPQIRRKYSGLEALNGRLGFVEKLRIDFPIPEAVDVLKPVPGLHPPAEFSLTKYLPATVVWKLVTLRSAPC